MSKVTLITAIHEAGHAVARLTHRGPYIRYISVIDQPEGRFGVVSMDDRFICGMEGLQPSENPPEAISVAREMARLDIIDALSGPIAEWRQRRTNWFAIELIGLDAAAFCFHGEPEPGSDLHAVLRPMRWLHNEPESMFQDYWCSAIELVKAQWAHIDALARLILKQGRIEADALYEWWAERTA